MHASKVKMTLQKAGKAGLCFALAMQLNAQEAAEKTTDNTFVVGINLIGVYLAVHDQRRIERSTVCKRRISKSTTTALHPQNNVGLDVAFHPVSIVIAVPGELRVVEECCRRFRRSAPYSNPIVGESGEAALIAFDHRIRVLQDFTSDTGKISEAVKKIKPGSSQSFLNDTILTATEMLEAQAQGSSQDYPRLHRDPG